MSVAVEELVAVLMRGGIAVVRTDTLYGVLARAEDERAVERVYQAKQRHPQKSCIILLAEPEQAYGNVKKLSEDIRRLSAQTPTSFLVDSPGAPAWLLRADTMLAYRIPEIPWLQSVIRQTGPLIAPSANLEGEVPANTIDEAREYFGEAVDYYADGGTVPRDTAPSRLIRIEGDGTITRLR